METSNNVLLESDKSSPVIDSYSHSNEHSLSNSPSPLSETETYRTIFSLLINQRKANLDLEQQLKHLQSSSSSNKSISPNEHQTHSFGKE
jgi:hypothetical protein